MATHTGRLPPLTGRELPAKPRPTVTFYGENGLRMVAGINTGPNFEVAMMQANGDVVLLADVTLKSLLHNFRPANPLKFLREMTDLKLKLKAHAN